MSASNLNAISRAKDILATVFQSITTIHNQEFTQSLLFYNPDFKIVGGKLVKLPAETNIVTLLEGYVR